jgi:segregation and condensation protein A
LPFPHLGLSFIDVNEVNEITETTAEQDATNPKLQYATRDRYEVHIPTFEGPLDLLLRLIRKKELDITKVALAQVTDDFLEQVDAMREAGNLAMIADFLAVAAQLLWLKSQALLPKPPASTAKEGDEEDIGDELVRQLRAYRRYKETAQWLRERDTGELRSYIYTAPLPHPKRVNLDLGDITAETLHAAAEQVMFPTEGPSPEAAIQRPRISITQQIRLVRDRLTHWARVSFHKLLSREPTRVEAVVTLQAILELVKQQVVSAQQDQRFGPITIERRVAADQMNQGSEDAAETSASPEPPPAPPPYQSSNP